MNFDDEKQVFVLNDKDQRMLRLKNQATLPKDMGKMLLARIELAEREFSDYEPGSEIPRGAALNHAREIKAASLMYLGELTTTVAAIVGPVSLDVGDELAAYLHDK